MAEDNPIKENTPTDEELFGKMSKAIEDLRAAGAETDFHQSALFLLRNMNKKIDEGFAGLASSTQNQNRAPVPQRLNFFPLTGLALSTAFAMSVAGAAIKYQDPILDVLHHFDTTKFAGCFIKPSDSRCP